MRRLFAAIAAALVMTVGLALPADAGGNSTLGLRTSALLGGPCGSSYTHVGHHPISGGGRTLGYLDVYWSWSTKRNCLVTNHSGPTYGVSLYTEARIRPSGYSWPSCPSSTGCDGGFYRYYAGPVYTPSGVDMTHRCVDISGLSTGRRAPQPDPLRLIGSASDPDRVPDRLGSRKAVSRSGRARRSSRAPRPERRIPA